MISIRVYIRERLEEIRSRLTVLRSTHKDLKQDFWAIFEAFYSRGITPPYLFPVSSFQRLEANIRTCKLKLENSDVDWPPYRMAYQLNVLDGMTRNLLCELNRLQNVLSHRCSGIGKLKQFEYQRIAEFEYGAICKAYNAVDALTFELIRKTMGSSWINEERYVPISLFDDRGYMINLYSYVVSIPYYDNFRSRFWSILAHEVGHVLVSNQARIVGPLGEIMLQGQEVLIEEIGIQENPALLQIAELTSDVIGAYVCPTVFLSGLECNSMAIPVEFRSGQLIAHARFGSHPPSDSRLTAMGKVLELSGISEIDADVKKICESASTFFARKNLAISQPSQAFIEKYNDFVIQYSEKAIRELPRLGIQGFGSNEWSQAIQSLESLDIFDCLPPSSVLAVVWLKRLRKTKHNDHLNLQNFFNERRNETKTFEYTVEQMYKYYESEVVPRIRVTSYDLRFDFS